MREKHKHISLLAHWNIRTKHRKLSGDAHSPAVLPWKQILAECSVSVCVCVCSVGAGGVKAVGGPGSKRRCRGVRGRRSGQWERESQGGWRHFFWVGLPVVGVLVVTVWNLWKNSEMHWDCHPRRQPVFLLFLSLNNYAISSLLSCCLNLAPAPLLFTLSASLPILNTGITLFLLFSPPQSVSTQQSALFICLHIISSLYFSVMFPPAKSVSKPVSYPSPPALKSWIWSAGR